MRSRILKADRRIITVEDGKLGTKESKKYDIPASEFNPRRLFEARRGITPSRSATPRKPIPLPKRAR